MTQRIPHPVLNGSQIEAGIASVLPQQEFLRLAPALDLSTEEWLRVFQAHSELPSSRREIFHKSLEEQIMFLSWGVHDDDPCPESLELSRRVEALPRILKLTVLEAIERFWNSEAKASSWEERLQHLGLRPCASAHDRLKALAHRRHIFSE